MINYRLVQLHGNKEDEELFIFACETEEQAQKIVIDFSLLLPLCHFRLDSLVQKIYQGTNTPFDICTCYWSFVAYVDAGEYYNLPF